MSIESMSVIEQTTAMRDGLAPGKIRALIAKHLGADWLDRVELVIAIEDQFAGVEITDDDVDQINVVADLIRCIERPDSERAGALAAGRNAPPVHRFFGPRPRAEWNSLLNKSAAAK